MLVGSCYPGRRSFVNGRRRDHPRLRGGSLSRVLSLRSSALPARPPTEHAYSPPPPRWASLSLGLRPATAAVQKCRIRSSLLSQKSLVLLRRGGMVMNERTPYHTRSPRTRREDGVGTSCTTEAAHPPCGFSRANHFAMRPRPERSEGGSAFAHIQRHGRALAKTFFSARAGRSFRRTSGGCPTAN